MRSGGERSRLSGAGVAASELSHEDVEVDIVRGSAASACVETGCRRSMKTTRGGDATMMRWFW
jgi:hypothetical protein